MVLKRDDTPFTHEAVAPLSGRLASVLDALECPAPPDAPGVLMVAQGAVAYARGDFAQTVRCWRALGDDDAPRLCAASVALAAGISAGDGAFVDEVEAFLQQTIARGDDPRATAYAELALCTAPLSALAPSMAPAWLREGDFSGLIPQAFPDAAYKRAKYFQCVGDFPSMLAVSQTALAFMGDGEGLTLSRVYLRLACAVACFAMGRAQEAEALLQKAMRACLPYGWIAPFVEQMSHCGGAVERLMEQEYPALLKPAQIQWQATSVNWIAFHNRFTHENVTTLLTRREYQIAALVARGMPRRQIAEQFCLSIGRLNNVLTEIYGKLSISGRDALKRFIITH